MPMEEWKDIEGYEGLYQVSSEGRVRSLDRWTRTKGNSMQLRKGRMLKHKAERSGYLRVKLAKNGTAKMFLIHRLVANAFIPNPDNLPQVNHKNEIKTDNRAENLEWCNNSYNCNYGKHNQRLGESLRNNPKKSKKVYQYTLDGKLIKTWSSTAECGRNGFSQVVVCLCCKGLKRNKTHKGFRWSYTHLEAPND